MSTALLTMQNIDSTIQEYEASIRGAIADGTILRWMRENKNGMVRRFKKNVTIYAEVNL